VYQCGIIVVLHSFCPDQDKTKDKAPARILKPVPFNVLLPYIALSNATGVFGINTNH
jgi:hypothetical protein